MADRISRREFLEKSAVAGAAAVVLALLAFATLILMNLLTRRTRADTAV